MRNNLGPTGIALMDIDDFKICNDTYGHHAGDLALETVAKAIRPNIRVTALYLLMGVLLLLAVTLFPGGSPCALPRNTLPAPSAL